MNGAGKLILRLTVAGLMLFQGVSIGFLTRPAVVIIAVELQFFYIGASLAIAFLGSGRYALSKGQGRWD